MNKKEKKLRDNKAKFEQLPREIISKISDYLDPDSIFSLRQVSSKCLSSIENVNMKEKVELCAAGNRGMASCLHSQCIIYALTHKEERDKLGDNVYHILISMIINFSPEDFKYTYEKIKKPYGRFYNAINMFGNFDNETFNSDNIMYLISENPRGDYNKNRNVIENIIKFGDAYTSKKLIERGIVDIEFVVSFIGSLLSDSISTHDEYRTKIYTESISHLSPFMSDEDWCVFFNWSNYNHHVIDDIYHYYNVKFTLKQFTYFMEYRPDKSYLFCFLILDRGDYQLFRSFFLRIISYIKYFINFRPREIGGTLDNYLDIIEELENNEDYENELLMIIDYATQKFPEYMIKEVSEKYRKTAESFMIESKHFWYPKIVSELFNEGFLDSQKFIARRLGVPIDYDEENLMFYTLAKEYTFKSDDLDLAYQEFPDFAIFLAFYYFKNEDFRNFMERHHIEYKIVVELLKDPVKFIQLKDDDSCPDKQNIIDISVGVELDYVFYEYVYQCKYEGLAHALQKVGHMDAYKYLTRFLIVNEDSEQLKFILTHGLIDVKTLIEEAEYLSYEKDVADNVIKSMEKFDIDDYVLLMELTPKIVVPAFMNLRINLFVEFMEKVKINWEFVADQLEDHFEDHLQQYKAREESSVYLLKNYNYLSSDFIRKMFDVHGIDFYKRLEENGVPNVYDLMLQIANSEETRYLYVNGYFRGDDILRSVVESQDIDSYRFVSNIPFTEEERQMFFNQAADFAAEDITRVPVINSVFPGITNIFAQNFSDDDDDANWDDFQQNWF